MSFLSPNADRESELVLEALGGICEPWAYLTDEELRFAHAAGNAILSSPMVKHGINESSLVIATDMFNSEESPLCLVSKDPLVDFGKSGEYDPARSYEQVMSGDWDELFKISFRLDGTEYVADTRYGMTWVAYHCLSEYCRGRRLGSGGPEDDHLADDLTLITGGGLLACDGPYANTDGKTYSSQRAEIGTAYGFGHIGDTDGMEGLRVHPAVIIRPEVGEERNLNTPPVPRRTELGDFVSIANRKLGICPELS